MFNVNWKYICRLLSHDKLFVNSGSLLVFPNNKVNETCWRNLHFWITFVSIRDYFPVHLPQFSPLQPVHNNGSSGYGSLGSNGSHEPYISVASSSDSNGNLWEDSHREPVRQRSLITFSQADCIVDGKINRAGILFVYYCRWPYSRSVLMWTEQKAGAGKFIWGQVTKSLSWENLREVMKPNTFRQ